MNMRRTITIGAVCAVLAAPSAAQAFCGFYVSGAGADLFNNATQVVMMRQGTRTVLSMQNNYQGPPEDFAMVVPVPVVLQKENVKTLPPEVFARVDKLSAPRLVEYWEIDPCHVEPDYEMAPRSASPVDMASSGDEKGGSGVKIEAQFKVGEYDIVILSAKEATGLDSWLRANKYRIPDGAAPYLKPYVEGGSKFFVARVDTAKVKFEGNQAKLSPLRFHYDSKDFNLPIRLGMMNSAGTQDLIVNILAPAGQRYEVANYKNVTIPTNLDVKEVARTRFGEFYAALFDRTLEKNPGAVVTEYAWDSGSCDPCPEPPLEQHELATLGADVLGGDPNQYWAMVLTRLHARYSKDGISEDLVFKAAEAIMGGREFRNAEGKLEEGATRGGGMNNFQGRYAIRHEWTGPIACEKPVRGRWGGPPAGSQQVASGPQAATDLAFVPRGKLELAQAVRSDVPEIALVAAAGGGDTKAEPGKEPGKAEPGTTEPGKHGPKKEKKGCAAGGSGGGLALAGLALAAVLLRRRRRS
jgi:uncharacterized protein (TIGR03382 family)